jgi:hypothetical protein
MIIFCQKIPQSGISLCDEKGRDEVESSIKTLEYSKYLKEIFFL